MDIARPDLKTAKRRRQWIIAGCAVAALSVATFALARLGPAAPGVERSSVWLDTVKRGQMLREVRGPGTLVPKEIRWLAAETSARVERIVIKPGAMVTPDSVILELSNPEVEEQLLAAKSTLAAAQADFTAKRVDLESRLLDEQGRLATTQADYESAALQVQAEGELFTKGVVSALTLKQSQLKADQLKTRLGLDKQRVAKYSENTAAQLSAERARVDQAQNALALRQRQAGALQVRAGIEGVLQQVPVEVGQQVAAGVNLARVAQPTSLLAQLRIAETQAKDIVIGQTVKVDTRNGIVDGHVTRIDPAVQAGTVLVDVDLDGALPPGARPDLSIDGTIEIEKLADVIYVARPAFGQPGASTTLFKLEGEGHIAVRVPVQLGRASVTVVEVLKGLKPGDQVILSDTSQWDAYERIKLQ